MTGHNDGIVNMGEDGQDQHLSLRRAGNVGTVAEVVLPYHTAADLHAEAAPAIA